MRAPAINLKENVQEERIWLKEAQRDPSAFQPIFEKYHDAIFNYVLRRTGDLDLAKDLTANTFLKALDNLKRFEWQGIALSSWLYRIATNEINQDYRKSRRQTPLTKQHTRNLPDDRSADSRLLHLEESLQKNQKFRQVRAALSKLKLKYQSVLTLRYFEEKPIKEIAEILNLSENTVKTHIRRGLIQLRNLL